ncbi:hypothetical protein DZK27_13365 [Rhodobacteraceae bacterium 63075]|nr:hypothetical protein DZK27_13365 [Rhodobacteraceae bacterium 63075]
MILKHGWAAFALALLLGAVMATGTSAQQLWNGSFVSAGKCRSHSGIVGPETHSGTLRGFEWPHPKGSGIEYIDRNARGINALASGRGGSKQLRARLLNAAQGKAFTRLDFGARGGSSPSFVSAIVVESTAYATSLLRAKGAFSAQDIRQIDGWVQTLLRNARKRAGSPDHKAAIGTARLLWGAAISDKQQFSKGYRQVNATLRKLRRGPALDRKTRINNEIMHQIIHAGIVLYRNGIDVFSKKWGSASLHDAVAQHAAQVRQVGTDKLQTTTGADKARSIFKARGWGTHLAWIPLYLSHFPRSGAANEVRALDRALRRVDRNPYYGTQIGIHSDCIYGRY